jgi:bifunctional non-homologous end joining protein LigD
MVITHPEKQLFPDDGITKGDLAAYYQTIAPLMLPHILRRPVTMERFPAGIGSKGFLQKNVAKGFPSWLERVDVPKKDGVVHHPVVTGTESLLWLVNQNCITPHVFTSRAPNLRYPDICVFDLDPSIEDLSLLRGAAIALRDVLAELELPSWVKTSGSKGFHIVIPLDGKTPMEDAERFAHGIGTLLVRRNPRHFTQEFHKVNRGKRVLIDTGRNGWTATHAAVYAVRARRGAPVSAPCSWEEVESGKIEPQSLNLRNMPGRVAQVGDLWSDMRRRRRSLRRFLGK